MMDEALIVPCVALATLLSLLHAVGVIEPKDTRQDRLLALLAGLLGFCWLCSR
jgi:hypothetical protein